MRGYRDMDRIYPTRPIAASSSPDPLPSRPADLGSLRYAVGGATFDLNGFINHNNVVGLLVVRDGQIALERYARGNTAVTRWYSFSVAKSVVSMLVGAAVKDGFIASLDAPVSDYVPVLRGSAYDAVTLRQAMTMTSGVAWDEDYADPQSDIARVPGRGPPAGSSRRIARRSSPRWVARPAAVSGDGSLFDQPAPSRADAIRGTLRLRSSPSLELARSFRTSRLRIQIDETLPRSSRARAIGHPFREVGVCLEERLFGGVIVPA